MKIRLLAVSVVAAFIGTFTLATDPAQATEATNDNPCAVQGFYVNEDETADAPERTTDGFVFDKKDLIHHAIAHPMEFADVKTNSLAFDATTAGKVLGKMETENPYSTINQNLDGTFWSTAMTYEQEGGQGHPVANVSDLIGLDTKPGKAKYTDNSHVTTFGVGYIVEEGSTTVRSITFHGVNYDLTCNTEPTEDEPTTPPATTAPTSTPTSAAPVVASDDKDKAETLPVTGTPVWTIVVAGLSLVGIGVAWLWATRRRKIRYTA